MYGHTFGNNTEKVGGSFPVWRRTIEFMEGGGVFSELPPVGETICAATPVYQNENGGKLECLKFFKALSGSTGTKLNVRIGYGLPTPKVGDVLMAVPETLEGTGDAVEVKSVKVNEDNENLMEVTLSASLPTLAEDVVLTIAEAKGATQKMKVRDITGLTWNDVYISKGTHTATATIVWMGVVYANRIQPIPEIFRKQIPTIKFEREAYNG